jgi:hypothetical protein
MVERDSEPLAATVLGDEFHGPSYSLSQRRPLRTEAAGEVDAPLDDEPDTEAGAW